VAEAVRSHTENVKKEIETIRTVDADEAAIIAIELESTLAAQAHSLSNRSGDDMAVMTLDTNTERALIPTDIIVAAIDASMDTATQQSSTDELPAYEKLLARVELHTTRARELLASVTSTLEPALTVDIERRITDIERTVAAALTLSETDIPAAQTLLVDALQRTQRVVVYVSNIGVGEVTGLESMVPMVLTEEEKRARIISEYLDISERTNVLTNALPTINDTGVVDKLTTSLTSVQTELDMASTTAREGNLDGALGTLERILPLLVDLEQVASLHIVPTNDNSAEPHTTATSTATTTPTDDTDEEIPATSTESVSIR
jgi:hypothetical protein